MLIYNKYDGATIKKGDTVYIECLSGVGSGGESTIKEVTDQYVWCNNGLFNRETGLAAAPPWAYAIISKITVGE
jgi:hypothetical protein